MNEKITGKIHSIETFGLVDGPGVRFIAFMQGCRMRCQYCHNPETWQENCGEDWQPFFKEKDRNKEEDTDEKCNIHIKM